MKFSELCSSFWHNWNELKNAASEHTGIIVGAGVVTSVVGTILACRATLKVAEQAEEHTQMIEEVKEECATAEMTEKETKKAVFKTYRKIGKIYVKKYALPVGLLSFGYFLMIKGYRMEVAKNESLTAAYVALSTLFNKYRENVKAKIGEEQEAEIYNQTRKELAEDVGSENYKGPFKEGSYILFNDKCRDYKKGMVDLNMYNANCVQIEINEKWKMGKRVYVNDICRALGRPEIAGGWDWCLYKGLTDKLDFKLKDPVYNPEFCKGYMRDGGEEPIGKLWLIGFVHVSETYKVEYRREDYADGGVMGGHIGQDPVIVG